MKFGLLGEKLGHSYSPIIHNYVFEKLNINATYELIETPVEGLKHYINELRNGVYNGFNVTIPYKKTIMSLLDEIDDKALKIGSVNTIYVKDKKVIGTNTDYDGFLKTLEYYNILVNGKTQKVSYKVSSGDVITIEDGTSIGGLSTTVKELIIDNKLKDVKFKSYCYPDKFIEHGSVNELEDRYGFNNNEIVHRNE